VVIRVCLLFCRTPFGYACDPTEFQDGCLVKVIAPNSRLKETIREFLKAGEDFADAIDDWIIFDLIYAESRGNRDISEVASSWLLNDILPAINPMILDRSFWAVCLTYTVCSGPGHSLLPQVLRRCDTSMVRRGIIVWIETQDLRVRSALWNKRQNATIRDFRVLVEMSGGLTFIHEYPCGTSTSPLFAAMHLSSTFSCFRLALQKVDIDIRELIRFQIEMYPDGWTLERLLSLSGFGTGAAKILHGIWRL
jgi:hypothetical protein